MVLSAAAVVTVGIQVTQQLQEAVKQAFTSRHETLADSREAAARSLYFGSIDDTVTEKAMKKLCATFGKLESLAVQQARQCAFVNFEEAEAAAAALAALEVCIAPLSFTVVVSDVLSGLRDTQQRAGHRSVRQIRKVAVSW